MNPPPLVEGHQQLTGEWSLTLPFAMARRIEDESLVFWHSPRRLTFWLSAYGAEDARDPGEVLQGLRDRRSADAFDVIEEAGGGLLRHGYRLDEPESDGRVAAFYGHVVAPTGDYIVIAAYFDLAETLEDVLAVWRSMAWSA